MIIKTEIVTFINMLAQYHIDEIENISLLCDDRDLLLKELCKKARIKTTLLSKYDDSVKVDYDVILRISETAAFEIKIQLCNSETGDVDQVFKCTNIKHAINYINNLYNIKLNYDELDKDLVVDLKEERLHFEYQPGCTLDIDYSEILDYLQYNLYYTQNATREQIIKVFKENHLNAYISSLTR